MLFAWSSLLLMLAGHSLAAAPTTCYNQDGSIANNRYKPCPGTTYCCDSGDTCTTNGLCQQRNNHYPNMEQVAWWYDAKANRTSYGDFTFLYTASTCTNANFSGCSTRCTNANTPSYLWACNDDALTNYCCYDPSKSLGLWEHQSCCKYPGAVFQLDKPSIIAWNSTSASTPVSTSSTSSALPSSTTPATSGVSNTTAGNGPTPGMSQGTTIGISVGVATSLLLAGRRLSLPTPPRNPFLARPSTAKSPSTRQIATRSESSQRIRANPS
ncbi:uncharacterized protein K489DRAFT_102748 [Dissoconium aciculare CBS 342.82]|uniref:Uncharacterized protein n=1 Tax=Dissoconium aciculare CBS 342.82 TaxID=1314786 RepID=A0A6J3MGD8_9PEZI|nr:uncharacterized protein K489DRAFT_102748 [Dissoconium aciculare CBS 342.82]KAF1825962.1 hypothetical protein K489DRAFT_102748 [Dissoconium aciculare CBS 342.82]